MVLPDVYTLRFNAGLSTVPDPPGDFTHSSYTMNLRVANVPESGSSVLLLLIGLTGVIVVHRKMVNGKRVAA